ncbi:MAG: ligand-binding sensor domain-containing protein, partial [Phocaeicola sp.]
EGVAYFSNAKYAAEEASQPFYTVATLEDELCFVSDKGRVWCYSMSQDLFRLWELPVKDRIISLNRLSSSELLITTATQGLLIYNKETGTYTAFNQQNTANFPKDAIRSVYMDSAEEVWFEMTEWGKVCHFNPRTKQMKEERMLIEPQGADRSYPAFHIHEDINNNLWVHPQGGGLSWYNREEGKLYPFYNDPTQTNWKFSNKVHSMMSDNQGNLWFCTHSKGLEKATFYENKFELKSNSLRNQDLNSTTVRALFQDNEGRIWLGKRNGRIEIYTAEFQYLGYLDQDGAITKNGKPLEGVAYNIVQDREGLIWVATKGRGIVRLEKMTSGHYKITRYEYNEDDVYSLSHNSTYWIFEDKNGRLWIATFGGGLNYIEKLPNGEVRFISNRNNLKGYPIDKCYRTRHICADRKGNIWVGTSNGVVSFKEDFQSPESIVFNYHKYTAGDVESLSSNDVYSIVSTKKGELFFATFGGGLNQLISIDESGSAHFKDYTIQHGLPSDILLSIEEDQDGNLWISTENGLSKFYPELQQFENYNGRDLGRN